MKKISCSLVALFLGACGSPSTAEPVFENQSDVRKNDSIPDTKEPVIANRSGTYIGTLFQSDDCSIGDFPPFETKQVLVHDTQTGKANLTKPDGSMSFGQATDKEVYLEPLRQTDGEFAYSRFSNFSGDWADYEHVVHLFDFDCTLRFNGRLQR